MNKRRYILSTGIFVRLSRDMNECIKLASSFDIDGVELGFLFFDELLNLNLKEETIEILNKFNYNSLHAPGDIKNKYKDTPFFRDIIDRLKDLAKRTKCENITLHAGQIEDFDFVAKQFGDSFKICIENVRLKEEFKNEDLIRLLKKYPKFSIAFDTAHAMESSTEEFKNLYNKIQDRLALIHISASHHEKFHNFVSTCSIKNSVEALTILRETDCPVILEAGFREGFDRSLLINEIKFIKGIFGDA